MKQGEGAGEGAGAAGAFSSPIEVAPADDVGPAPEAAPGASAPQVCSRCLTSGPGNRSHSGNDVHAPWDFVEVLDHAYGPTPGVSEQIPGFAQAAAATERPRSFAELSTPARLTPFLRRTPSADWVRP